MDNSSGQIEQGDSVNYYQVLGVDETASKLEIRDAYIRLKNTFSGDNVALYSLVNSGIAKQRLELVSEAFRTLDNEIRRRQYNMYIRRDGKTDPNGSLRQGEEAPDAKTVAAIGKQKQLPMANYMKVAPGTDGADYQAKAQSIIEETIPTGETLKNLRLAAGVSPEFFNRYTKIAMNILAALENDQFELLPARVFVKGYLKNYLSFLSIPNADSLIDRYLARLDDWQKGRQGAST